MQPKRIMIAFPNLDTAGSYIHVTRVLERIDRSRFEPVICVKRLSDSDGEKKIRQLGIQIVVAPFTVAPRPYRSLLPRLWRAARFFRELRCTIWYSFNYLSDLSEPIIARLARMKFINARVHSTENKRWFLRMFLAHRIVAISEDTAHLPKIMPLLARKLTIVQSSIPNDIFSPHTPKRLKLREHLQLPNNAFVIAYLATLCHNKAQDRMLCGMMGNPRVHLVCAGAPLVGPWADHLRALATSKGLVSQLHFLGHIQDTAALLAESDASALLSRSEGLGVAILEAMASGLPCMVSRENGIVEILHHGDNGWVVDGDDPEQIKQCILQMMNNPEEAKRRGMRARQTILDLRHIDNETTGYENVFTAMSA